MREPANEADCVRERRGHAAVGDRKRRELDGAAAAELALVAESELPGLGWLEQARDHCDAGVAPSLDFIRERLCGRPHYDREPARAAAFDPEEPLKHRPAGFAGHSTRFSKNTRLYPSSSRRSVSRKPRLG